MRFFCLPGLLFSSAKKEAKTLYAAGIYIFRLSRKNTAIHSRTAVTIDDIPVAFEPDEEGQLRAIVESQHWQAFANIDAALIHAIIGKLQEALR